jgi:hypothetical protein
MGQEIREFLVMRNGSATARDPFMQTMSHLGLKLPINPKKIKSGPNGEILVQKDITE